MPIYDVLTPALVIQIVGEILGARLTGVTNIRAVFDFKTFLRGIRPRGADKDIKQQYSLQLKATGDGSAVEVRSKPAIDPRVQFGPWNRMIPNRARPDAIPHRDVVPPICTAQEWHEFADDIVPSLWRFYNNQFRHPVHIPIPYQKEMLKFLVVGPTPPAPPGWIAWDDTLDDENQVLATVVPAATVTAAAAAEDRRDEPVWKPFLQPRQRKRKCKCGSLTHSRISHKDCPLNPSRADQDSTATSEATAFPFPVGTRVAFEFDDGYFAGKVNKLYEGEDLCQVHFDDGDTADYDGDEITYASQLHTREFNS